MTLRERPHDSGSTPPAASGPTGTIDFRAAADRLLAQGGDAIARALSQDSAAFLAANRQEGGQ